MLHYYSEVTRVLNTPKAFLILVLALLVVNGGIVLVMVSKSHLNRRLHAIESSL